ncbi:endonuclease/exonuclease/phosphatase family protein [Motilimonas sp. KMU-193]|uniref:endonuclease/exonuclease/phosphatase family protein n=1 Tax=Motilimonas sp. KMU-193 TaxID=3388668 RepID=UPI00396B1973
MLNPRLAKFHKLVLLLAGIVLAVIISALIAHHYLQTLHVMTQAYDLETQTPYQAPSCNQAQLNVLKPASRGSLLPAEFSLLVWNVYKYQDPRWQGTLANLLKTHHLALLQEASSDSQVSQFWQHRGWQGFGASAFSQDGRFFGVQNLAKVEGQLVCVELSPEPWIQLPKSTLVTLYPMADTAAGLLVINVHGINFTLGTADWNLQLANLFALVERHVGPVIFAGDFNTWSRSRQLELREQAKQVGLSEVSFTPDQRLVVMGEPLDHIYIKDIEVVSAKAYALAGSDHFPMEVAFKAIN